MNPHTLTLLRLVKLYHHALDLCLQAPEDQMLIRVRLHVENTIDMHLAHHPHEGCFDLTSLLFVQREYILAAA